MANMVIGMEASMDVLSPKARQAPAGCASSPTIQPHSASWLLNDTAYQLGEITQVYPKVSALKTNAP